MATSKRFEEIVSWQKARELNKIPGKHIDAVKFKNSYKLINQLEGSAGSIMDNIAEGFERSDNREFCLFLYLSKGSCGEFKSQLYRALERGYLAETEFEELYNFAMETIVLLQKLINYPEQSELKVTKFKNRSK